MSEMTNFDSAGFLLSFRGACAAREPGIQKYTVCIWIPGPALARRPGMTGERHVISDTSRHHRAMSWSAHWNSTKFSRVDRRHNLKISAMDQRDQELLDKQLWGVSPAPPGSESLIGIAFLAVLLVGIAIGATLFASERKQMQTASHDVTAALLRGLPRDIR